MDWVGVIKEWLVENAVVLGSIGAIAAIIGIPTAFKSLISSNQEKGVKSTKVVGNGIASGGNTEIIAPVIIGDGSSVDQSIHYHEIDPHKLAEELFKRQSSAYSDLQQKEEEIKSLTQAIDDLKRAAEVAPKSRKNQFHEAFGALEKGETQQAEILFQTIAKNAEKTAKDSKEKEARAYRNLGAIAFLTETKKAIKAYLKATDLAPDNAIGWNQLGHLYRRTGEIDKATDAYNCVLALGETADDQDLIAVAYGNLGLLYKTRGELDKTEEFYLKSLAINETLGSKEGMASAYGNLGILYQTRGELNKAEEFHLKSLAIDETLGRKEGMASQYGNLGILYKTRGELDKAEEFYLKSLAINETLGSKEGMASDYGNLGILYKTRGELDKAEEFYLKSLAINETLGRKEGMANQYTNLGNLYKTRGELDKARESWEASAQLFKSLGSLNADRVQDWIDSLEDNN